MDDILGIGNAAKSTEKMFTHSLDKGVELAKYFGDMVLPEFLASASKRKVNKYIKIKDHIRNTGQDENLEVYLNESGGTMLREVSKRQILEETLQDKNHAEVAAKVMQLLEERTKQDPGIRFDDQSQQQSTDALNISKTIAEPTIQDLFAELMVREMTKEGDYPPRVKQALSQLSREDVGLFKKYIKFVIHIGFVGTDDIVGILAEELDGCQKHNNFEDTIRLANAGILTSTFTNTQKSSAKKDLGSNPTIAEKVSNGSIYCLAGGYLVAGASNTDFAHTVFVLSDLGHCLFSLMKEGVSMDIEFVKAFAKKLNGAGRQVWAYRLEGGGLGYVPDWNIPGSNIPASIGYGEDGELRIGIPLDEAGNHLGPTVFD